MRIFTHCFAIMMMVFPLTTRSFAEEEIVVVAESPVQMTSSEKAVYDRGEITGQEWAVGGLLGTFLGFGVGHAVYDRYWQKGWIFTVSEAFGVTMMAVGGMKYSNGESMCRMQAFYNNQYACEGDNRQLLWGVGIYLGFHIWEIVDVWLYPSSHNREYRKIEKAVGLNSIQWSPLVQTGETTSYGLQLGFKF